MAMLTVFVLPETEPLDQGSSKVKKRFISEMCSTEGVFHVARLMSLEKFSSPNEKSMAVSNQVQYCDTEFCDVHILGTFEAKFQKGILP